MSDTALEPNDVLGDQLRRVLLEMMGKGVRHAEIVVNVSDVQMHVLLTLASCHGRDADEGARPQ